MKEPENQRAIYLKLIEVHSKLSNYLKAIKFEIKLRNFNSAR
jgi:hypothetical protein